MKCKVEACWNGKRHYFCVTTPDGFQWFTEDPKQKGWTRELAKQTLDDITRWYRSHRQISRRSIRFVHV